MAVPQGEKHPAQRSVSDRDSSAPDNVGHDSGLVDAAAFAIFHADYLLIAAGAGASADSNLPCFNQINATLPSVGGINCSGVGAPTSPTTCPQKQLLPQTYDQLASLDSFARTTKLFYGFWARSLEGYRKATPHAGYSMLYEWARQVERRGPLRDGARQVEGRGAESQGNNEPTGAYRIWKERSSCPDSM